MTTTDHLAILSRRLRTIYTKRSLTTWPPLSAMQSGDYEIIVQHMKVAAFGGSSLECTLEGLAAIVELTTL